MMGDSIQGELTVCAAVAAILDQPRFSASRLVLLESDQSIIELPSGRVARVLDAPGESGSLAYIIDHALSHNIAEGTELILLGGDEDTRKLIVAHVPKLRMNAFFVHHISESGKLSTWPEGRGSLLALALAKISPLSDRQERELFEKAAFDRTRAATEHQERIGFFHRVNGQRAPMTVALLAAIALMFLLQLSFSNDVMGALGLGESDPKEQQYWLILSIAMGALWSPSVLDGEFWRAISAGFLHFNLMHIAANSFVLYMLGSQLEKVLGSYRFIIIYTVALLGGSLASTFLTDGVGVGASGAIWGLLGAQVALAYGRPPVLPASIARTMKPVAMRNLVLNVGISFIGGIDWAAHFGGGLAGGLLLASGVLYENRKNNGASVSLERNLKWASWSAIVLLVAGVTTALVVGQPWRLSDELSL